MRFLGAIKEIRKMELIVSLPHNLTATIPITEISDVLSEKISASVNSDDEDSDEDEVEESKSKNDIPQLSSLFSIGQLVKCVVIQLRSELKNKKKRKLIEASMKPSLVNKDHLGSLSAGMVIYGEVKSEEDHGYVIGFGSNEGITGFLPKRFAGDDLKVGQPVDCIIRTNYKANSPTIPLSAERKAIQTATVSEENLVITLSMISPGMLVKAQVKKVLPNGLFVNFLSYFTGTIESSHVDMNLSKNIANEFKVGQKLKARILFVDYQSKKVNLSLLPHIINVVPFGFDDRKVGDFIDDIIVHKIIPDIGLLLKSSNQLRAFSHVLLSSLFSLLFFIPLFNIIYYNLLFIYYKYLLMMIKTLTDIERVG